MEQDFIYHQQREGCNNLVLFVHGFTGDVEKTWTNKNGVSFPQLILKNHYLRDNFDVASYSYFTKLLDLFADGSEKFRSIKNLIRRVTHKKQRNLDITELSNNLSNHFRFTLSQYDNIYIIAHSMGGLITKSLIADALKKAGTTKVKLFLSLAVPHSGSDTAVLGGIISNNLQIDNLNPVSEFITNLNQTWIELDNKPTTKYFYGSYDTTVPKSSAVAIDNIEKDVISVAEDHPSISKPEDERSIVYNSICQFIEKEHKYTKLDDVGYQKLVTEEQYDEELFAIKLIVADIADDTQKHSKELYFNAEYVRKLFNSRHDKKQLSELFENIRQLYKDSYGSYLAEERINSGMLLADVQNKITAQDSLLLKSVIPTLKNYHKKGMLHQLANNSESDIWWSEKRDLDTEGTS